MSSKRKQGFTLVEIMIVVAIIAILAAIGVPAFLRYRQQSGSGTCLANIMSIQGAKEAYASTLHPTTYEDVKGDAVAVTIVQEYIRGRQMPVCPNAGTYSIENLVTWPNCSNTADTDDLCQHDDEHFPDLE